MCLMVPARTGHVLPTDQRRSTHYPDRPAESRQTYELVMEVIAKLPQAERLGHRSGSTVVVGKLLLRLEEERPNESMCLQIAGHNESEVTRCGTDLIVRKMS